MTLDTDPRDPAGPTDAAAAAPPASWGEPRTRTVTWFDPLQAAATGAQLPGRAYLEAIADGTLPPPPIASLFSFRITEVGDGEARFAVVPDESAYNPIGLVHGGLVCTLLDSVVGCAVHSQLPAGTGYTSIELKVSYLRPVRADSGEIHAHGWVTKPGRRVAFAEGDVRSADGALLASASSSLLIIAP
ncbi:PaaI family thioesterase [Conexibacter sp. JD483]|uniref:PaaI family thioesterase n=1 Tax=unclassified Conexibacter TaxID=2627773 RepID=UPI002720D399|nr:MULTISPECIES: PaaI family thioesterase [unclassified Conexibacter]MDO8184954.1 PaaI family thioesterase [Conexibacter sp. CPCC 205706]MDO8198098.1 PaaI family thioesterase [Conexibacter sp. CPCC 205762]MDR9368280.1 PaaI family thioesterase [Conexibacter sp. JD483]